MMKRIVSLMLALAMVLSLMAGICVSVGAEEYTLLQEASITGSAIPDLAVGDTLPALSYSVAAGANYTVTEATWFKDSNTAAAGDVVENGHAYELRITVKANDGYAFDQNNITLLINGEEHDFIPVDGRGEGGFAKCHFTKDYSFQEAIEKAEVSFEIPEIGKPLSEAKIPDGVNYTVTTDWYDASTGQSVAIGTTAAKGGSYEVQISLFPVTGYEFTEDTEFWLNGELVESAVIDFDVINYWSDHYNFSEPIDSVSITYAEPVAGQPLPMPVAGDGNYEVEENSTGWYDYTAEKWVSAGTVAEKGHTYYLDLWVAPAAGYKFTEDTELYVNGELVDYREGSDGCIVWASEDYYFSDPIAEVYVNYTEPVAGQVLADAVIPAGANYTVESNWYDYDLTEEGGGHVEPGAVAIKGHQYDLEIEIYPAFDYRFTDDTVVWLNGEKLTDSSEDGWGVSKESIWIDTREYFLAEPISEVRLTYAEPVLGQALPMPVAQDAAYTINESTKWYDYAIGEYLEAGTVAELGHEYDLEIFVEPAAGYKFTEETVLWVNGVQIGADDVSISSENINYCTKTYEFTQKVSAVAITCAEPVVGQPFPVATVSADAGYTVESYWMDMYTYELAEGNVQDGGIYQLLLGVYTKSGYRFAEEVTLTVNGSPVDENDYYYGENYLNYYPEYSFAKSLDKIEVNYVMPEVGKAPGAITIPAGANYTLGEYSGWYDYSTGEMVTGVFETGKRYGLNVELLINFGYEVTKATEVYVNGKKATNYWDDHVSLTVMDFCSFATAIDKVDLPAWPELKVGDTLPAIEGTGTNYSYFVDWYGEDVDGNELEGTTVQDGALYYAYMYVVPAEGYEFNEKTVFTMGGGDLTGWTYMDYSHIEVDYLYNFSDMELIDKVELSVSIPGIGQSGGAVTVPADAEYEIYDVMWAAASDETYSDLRTQNVVYQQGDRILLGIGLDRLGDSRFSPDAVVTINGKEYKPVEIYGDPQYVHYTLDLGQVQEAPDYNGLTLVDGVWGYYEDGILQTDFTDLVYYEGEFFYVENGILSFDYTGLVFYQGNFYYVENSVLNWGYTGLVQYMGNWYYVQEGALQWGYYGLVQYNGVWFYVENSTLTFTYNGLVLYEGVWFYVENSSLTFAYTGLVEYGGNFYYVENSTINWSYTGLAMYNGNFYYVENGVLNFGYTGLATYMGNWYYVANGVLDWSFSSLYLYNGTWYVIQGGQLIWGYDGLVLYNDLWFYAENSMITWTYTGLVEYMGNLYYVEGSCLNWGYNGTATYNGVEYDVVGGVAIQ